MVQKAQSTIKPMNTLPSAIGSAMRALSCHGRCYIPALNEAGQERLNGRSQVAHRCLWTHQPVSTG
jgi:hypothetical protein